MTAIERQILTVCRDLMAEIAATRPPKNDRWEAERLAELRKYGPRYQPSVWFGRGEPLPERIRMRYLRALQGLADEGLVRLTTCGGKLANVMLTYSGHRALEETSRRKKAGRTVGPLPPGGVLDPTARVEAYL